MLEGINGHEIVVGAYQHGDGICPMLAAHRAGGRTSFISFAEAWDRFAFRGTRSHRARRATERELLILRTHLEASLLEDEAPNVDLRAVINQHHQRQQHADEPGSGWMRVVRRYDDYQWLLARLQAHPGAGAQPEAARDHAGV